MSGTGEDEPPHGTLEVGYQIGCGIDMSTSNGVTLSGSVGMTPVLGLAGLDRPCCRAFPALRAHRRSLAVGLKPGIINVVPVNKKEFKGADPWV